MSEHGWQQVKQVTVPAAGNITVVLTPSRPLLESFCIWASSGERVMTNMTFQPKVNNTNLGASTNVTGAEAAHIVFRAAGATFDQLILPVGKGTLTTPSTQGDPLEFSVLVSNAGLAPEIVTLYLVGIGRDGGGTIT